MKTLKFSKELVDLVIKGEKTTTWRLFDDKDLKTGDKATLIKRPELVPFAEAELVDVVEKPLGQLTEADIDGHEKFDSDEEMYQTYSKYYNKAVTAETLVKIIKFKILKFD